MQIRKADDRGHELKRDATNSNGIPTGGPGSYLVYGAGMHIGTHSPYGAHILPCTPFLDAYFGLLVRILDLFPWTSVPRILTRHQYVWRDHVDRHSRIVWFERAGFSRVVDVAHATGEQVRALASIDLGRRLGVISTYPPVWRKRLARFASGQRGSGVCYSPGSLLLLISHRCIDDMLSYRVEP